MENYALSFENVTVAFGEVEVLRNFSCDIKKGEFVSVIGPNGSGKSTMINAILQSIRTKSGEIYLNGKNNKDYSSKQRAQYAAVVPQVFSTSFAFKAWDVVMMGRNPYLSRMQSETAEDVAIVEEAMRITNTLHLKDRKITSLSGGERQRVIIAGALAQKPKLLILDEPTNHLDIHHTLEILQLVKKLNVEEGLTVFAVLHDINMAARFSDRLILMKNGVNVKTGTIEEIVNEETLKPVYMIDMVVKNNPLTQSLEMVALRKKTDEIKTDAAKVHVISGGGSGAVILEKLKRTGYRVTSGVLNLGDSDYDLCHFLEIPTVTEAPYNNISDEVHRKNVSVMNDSEVIIITDVPIGNGNLKNIEALNEINLEGKKIYVLPSENRDYTEGKKADRIIGELVEKGIAGYIRLNELVEKIEGYSLVERV
ncbi:MAG: ABC transporter ATP-binding protein [Eubacteriaceae bacterium]|nr:ABC transporter ATP-binding protein [Eubacteriaceae bacterium]